MSCRHFLTLNDLSADEFRSLIARAIELKASPQLAKRAEHKTLALIFEKSSTRTRVAFEVAMNQLGGSALFLSSNDSQLGRGEPIEDTARVLSRMVDCVAIRTFDHAQLEAFAAHSRVPVINALTDDYHPCQLLADMQTYVEHRGSIEGKRVAWIGDGNNMCHSYMNAAALLGFELTVASPQGFEPSSALIKAHSKQVKLCATPQEAVSGASLIVTDVWASMGQEEEQSERLQRFAGFQVNAELLSHAQSDALFMHCLPAHRGEEVSAELLDGSESVVWQEAENRMHSQKALLELLLNH